MNNYNSESCFSNNLNSNREQNIETISFLEESILT